MEKNENEARVQGGNVMDKIDNLRGAERRVT